MKTHKERNMDMLADHIRGLYRNPDLRQMALNHAPGAMKSAHCGSNSHAQSWEELR